MDESIKIGDKLLKGYTLLNDGKWDFGKNVLIFKINQI